MKTRIERPQELPGDCNLSLAKTRSTQVLLVLEDGTHLVGRAFSGDGETFGEFVFSTAMTGYQELLTDPSYRGQIVVMTYPEIGIYGVNTDDHESASIQVAGFVVHRAIRRPSNQRAACSIIEFMNQAGVLGIEGVDTRMLTRRIRDGGMMRGAISTIERDPQRLLARVRAHPKLQDQDLVQSDLSRGGCSPSRPRGRRRIVILDAGVKKSMVQSLRNRGVETVLLPFDTGLDRILSTRPDGLLISNGPGDPARVPGTVSLVREILKRHIPTAGICLGHQLLAIAIGARTYKMRFGHHGITHPVLELGSGRVLVTSQNHGFAVDPTSLGMQWSPLDPSSFGDPGSIHSQGGQDGLCSAGILKDRALEARWGLSPSGFGRVEMTHLSLNDGTLEGFRMHEVPALSVQYHPEASPGPHEATSFFDEFLALLEGQHA